MRRFAKLSVLGLGCSLAACGGGRYAGYAVKEANGGAYAPAPLADSAPNTEHYTDYGVNPPKSVAESPLSTFAVDVDTASYAIARRKLREGIRPPKEAVRAEEFLNAFDYGYAPPAAGSAAPFAVHLAAAPSPYEQGHHLLRVALKGKAVTAAERVPVHLVYLVDTSGSMNGPDRIGLAQKSLHLLTDALRQGDTVALCTYAGSVRKVLSPTGVEHKAQIHGAIDQLTAGGSTAMASGIDLAYQLANETFVKGHVNRVIVLSDGDANVGSTSHVEILKQIAQYKEKGITLSTVGFGSGNYQDTMMEQLADKGDGNYVYIDSEKQAKKVFVDQLDGLLQVIARDVKVQVAFDPAVVEKYRLVGYENRAVADKDFRNDKVDGGEIGAGHSVTAVYDVVLKKTDASPLTVRLRWKKPLGADPSTEVAVPMPASAILATWVEADARFRLAAAVTGLAELLRESPYAKGWSFATVRAVAKDAKVDATEHAELLELIGRAEK